MIKINLQSDKEKERLALEKRVGVVLRGGLSAVFVLLLLVAVSVSAQVVLRIYLASAEEESRARSGRSTGEMEEAEKLIKDINSTSGAVEKSSRETPAWSKVIARLSALCPAGVKITSIHVEKEHLKITGFSKSREAFLEFQEGLRGNGFSSLESPVSNLVSPADFTFVVETDVEKEYLNQP